MSIDIIEAVMAHETYMESDGLYGKLADFSHANLSGVDFSRANLSGAKFSGAKFSGANLCDTNFSHANLSGVDFSRANLSGAKFYGANLCDTNFYGADLYGADLYGANFYSANLSDTNLSGADLYGAIHIISFGPIGQERRIGYAVKHDNFIMIKLGCFWGTLEEAISAIREKYGNDSNYEKIVVACCNELNEGI